MPLRSWLVPPSSRETPNLRQRSRRSPRKGRARRALALEVLESRTLLTGTPTATLQLLPATGPKVTIAVDTFQFGFHIPITIGSSSSGAGAGKVTVDDLDATASYSANSPLMLKQLVTGQFYDRAILTQNDANGKALAVWTLGQVFVTSDAISGSSAGPVAPDEDLKFAFVSITEAAAPEVPTGHVTSASWDQVTNTASGPAVTTAPDPTAQYPADPAVTAVLTLQPLSGPSVTLPIDSYQFGFDNTGTIGSSSSGAGAGKATFDALDVTLPLGNASPALLAALTGGSHYDTATLTLETLGSGRSAVTVYAWAFNQVFVTDDVVSGSAGAAPEESVSFAFGAAVQKYVPQNPDGTLGTPVITGWSQVNNSSTSSDIPTFDVSTAAAAPLSAAATPLTAAVDATASAASSAAVAPPSGLTLTLSGGTAPALTVPIDLNIFQFGFSKPVTLTSTGATTGSPKFDALSVTTRASA